MNDAKARGFTVLSSYPKSGNTWLRAVIESLRTGGATIDINANGTDLFNMSFTSGAAAAQYFTDNPVNLGQLDSSLYAGGVLNLQSEVTVTGTAVGFWGGLLVSG